MSNEKLECLCEIYQKIFSTCEMDQSIDECQETLMMIEGKSELHGPLVPLWTYKLVPILQPDLQSDWPRVGQIQ